MPYRRERITLASYALLGATIITTALLHATYTELNPILTQNAIVFLLIPAICIGIICIEFKDAILVMFLAIMLSLLTMALVRSLPVVLGIVTQNVPFFVISQFALTLPLFFPLILVYTLGTVAGLIINEFLIEPRSKDLI